MINASALVLVNLLEDFSHCIDVSHQLNKFFKIELLPSLLADRSDQHCSRNMLST